MSNGFGEWWAVAFPRPAGDGPDRRGPTAVGSRAGWGTGDAVVIGVGSMIGAGVFAAFGPAARAAGTGLLVALVITYCNAVPWSRWSALRRSTTAA